MQTYIPTLEESSFQHKIEDVIEPSEVNHELLIEVIDGTMEIKNVEMFPNDVHISDLVDAAKSFRQSGTQLDSLETSSSLQWFIRNVQDRIILSTLRRFVVKTANKSRHLFEYFEGDEMIVAHLVGGVDAFIKPSQGWPLSNSPLKLISLKSSDHHSKGISLSFFCKVEQIPWMYRFGRTYQALLMVLKRYFWNKCVWNSIMIMLPANGCTPYPKCIFGKFKYQYITDTIIKLLYKCVV
ncbi:hypothetical protein CICLE_v10005758mg [Citrus x clementina]|uniref:Uncharacterized protein n=1 Tax=Citrus clementina TaxID=85681 RepID=V4RJF1_CITCL|nr:hypothetical protein CICLE_v10005758mg [Citrus x clementina]